MFDTDEYPKRDTNLEKYGEVQTHLRRRRDHCAATLPAATTAPLRPGALMSADKARSWASSPSPASSPAQPPVWTPDIMGMGPWPRTRKLMKALEPKGLKLEDFGLVEIRLSRGLCRPVCGFSASASELGLPHTRGQPSPTSTAAPSPWAIQAETGAPPPQCRSGMKAAATWAPFPTIFNIRRNQPPALAARGDALRQALFRRFEAQMGTAFFRRGASRLPFWSCGVLPRARRGEFNTRICAGKGFTMNPTRVDHIGIGVPNLEEACKFYEALGLVSGGTEIVADQKVKVAFFPLRRQRAGAAGARPHDGPIAKFLEKNGGHAGINMWPSGCQTSAQPLPR